MMRQAAHRSADNATLYAFARIVAGGLVRAFADADALDADTEAREIHHDEHVLETAILLADDVTGRAAVVAECKYRRRAGMDAELMLE